MPRRADVECVHQLDRLAIRLEHRTCGPSHAGLYYSKQRLLVICTNNTGLDTPMYHETLAHEALHVVHDCQAGRIGDGLIASMAHQLRSTGDQALAKRLNTRIHASLGAARVAFIHTLYPAHRVELELEADVLEHLPDRVAGFLETCRP